jgi:outer membrane receptor protein involved in Fe transport
VKILNPSLALALCAVIQFAQAQEAPKKTTAEETPVLEEIIITAEKRESTVQKTPISMTAVSGVDMQAQGLSDFQSIAQETPGVSFKTSGPGQTEYEMRGLTSTGGFSPTVGFYVDDAPLTAPSQAAQGKVVIDPDLYDLNRVEVLRGPQGTLYGSGSMGGTIKLITNPPALNKFSASAQTIESDTHGGGFNYGGSAMLNLPLAQDVASLRIVATDKYVSGWIDRVVLNPFPMNTNGGLTRGDVAAAPVQARISDVNSEHLDGARATLLLQIGDRLTITPGIMYQRITQDGENTIDDPPGNQFAHFQPFNTSEPSEDNFSIYTLVVKYHFDGFDLTSATAKWNRHDDQQQDISETMQDLFGFPSYSIAGGGVGPGTLLITDESSQANEEIRLASNNDSKFQWLGGLFYSNFESNTKSYSNYLGFANLFGTSDLIDIAEPITIKQKAVFGEVSYQITSQLKGTVGLRYYQYTSTEETINNGLATIAGGNSTILEFGNAKNSGYNPKVNLAYTVNDDVLVYTTAAKGFRPGGPNSPVPLKGPVQCLTGPGNLESLGLTSAPTQFNPDGVWSYEVGEKARALGGHLIINGDVYYENWTNVQQAVDPSCGFGFTSNAGAATIYGSEIELSASLTPAWTVTQNLGLTHATFNETVQATNTTKGTKILDVPNATASTSLVYTTPVSVDYNFVARGTYSYVGSMQDITYTRNDLAGYALTNLRFGVTGHAFSTFLFVDNLTDKMAILTNSVATTVNVPQFNRLVTSQPRTIGIDFQYRY